MKSIREDKQHVLLVEREGDELNYIIEHPGCPTSVSYFAADDGICLVEHECLTGAFWVQAGTDALVEKPAEPGRYAIRAWYQGPGWAGADPIDPEGWIDVLSEAGT